MEETGGGGLESRIDAYPGSLEKKEGKKGRKKKKKRSREGKGCGKGVGRNGRRSKEKGIKQRPHKSPRQRKSKRGRAQ